MLLLYCLSLGQFCEGRIANIKAQDD